MNLQLEELIQIVHGTLQSGGPDKPLTISGVSTDSRSAVKGDVFFALKGDNFDGHNFVQNVAEAGVQVIVASQPVSQSGVAVVLVSDTLIALGQLATWWRSKHKIPMSVVVGSSGKTTTKEMAGEILSRYLETLSTKGNFNNLIGLPMTLFTLTGNHEAAVLELGMNCPDENRKLTDIAQPDCVCLTNINHAHIGMFDSVRQHFEAEAEPIRFAPESALLIINNDDPLSNQALQEFGGDRKVWRYSVEAPADYYAENIRTAHPFGYTFDLKNANGQSSEVQLQMFGRHNVSNAVAAAAIAAFHGISLDDAAEQLSMFKPRYNRSEVDTIGGVYVIKDYYNAIPAAVISALKSLRDLDVPGRRFAVLGDMLELGVHEKEFHEQVGVACAKAGLERLYTIGDRGKIIADKACSEGCDVRHFSTLEELAADLNSELVPGDLLLIKGSRAMKLENLFELLKPTAIGT